MKRKQFPVTDLRARTGGSGKDDTDKEEGDKSQQLDSLQSRYVSMNLSLAKPCYLLESETRICPQ